ncbi:unnamed protein product [Amoebophrya sp. A25]|nr:unnamed protein product [Amoebophrya sp. A25]|eukprot:GSA25T00015876001.1
MNLGQKQAHSSFLELAECDGSFFNLGAEYGIHSGLPERVERYLESSGDVMTLQVMPLQVDSESIAEQQRAPHSSRSTSSKSSFSSSAGPSRSGAPFLKLNPADDGRSPMDVEDNWQWEYARIRQCPASATPSSAREEKYLLEVLENQNNAGNRRKVFACARLNILEPEQPSTTKSDTAATTGIQAQGDAAPASSDTSTVGADLLNAQMGNGFFASLTDADLMAAGETASAASPAPLAKQEPRGAMNTYRILVPIPIEDVWIPKRISSPSLEPICDNFHRYRKRIAEAFNKMATSVAIQDEHVVASSSSGDHGRGLLSSKSTSPAAPGQRRVQLQSSSSFPKHAKRSGAFLSTRRLEDDVARSTARRGDAEESTTKGTDVDVDSSTVVLPIPALSDLPLWVLPRKWGLRTEFCESDFPARGTADISIDEAYRKLHLGIWGWGIVNRLHPTGAQLLDETSNHSAEKDSVLDQVEPDERTSDVLGNYERSSEDLNNNDIKGSSTSGEAKAAQETTRKRSLEDDEAGDTSTSTESSSTDTGSEMKQEEQLQLVEAKNEKGRRIFLPLNFYRYSPPSEDLISQEKYHLREELFFCYNNYGDPKMRAKIENSDYGQFSPAWVGDPAKKPLPPLSRQFLHEMDPETGTDVWTSEDKPLPPTPVDV